jgi:hypothetical protein
MTPSGIDTAIFRFVAPDLTHCATACPQFLVKGKIHFKGIVIRYIHSLRVF